MTHKKTNHRFDYVVETMIGLFACVTIEGIH